MAEGYCMAGRAVTCVLHLQHHSCHRATKGTLGGCAPRMLLFMLYMCTVTTAPSALAPTLLGS
jgi:hypothetical protein